MNKQTKEYLKSVNDELMEKGNYDSFDKDTLTLAHKQALDDLKLAHNDIAGLVKQRNAVMSGISKSISK